MEITFSMGVSAITAVALFNGIATTIKLMRQRKGNGSITEAISSLLRGQELMCKNQTEIAKTQQNIIESQRANVLVTDTLRSGQKDFVACFQKMETSAVERAIYLKGILDELKAMNKDRR